MGKRVTPVILGRSERRVQLPLSRSQVQKIADWSFWHLGEARTEDEAAMYEDIVHQCEKALKYDAGRRARQSERSDS